MKYVYRVVNALLGVGVLLSAFFADFIKVTIGTAKNLDEFFLSISDEGTTGIAVKESLSIKRVIDIVNGKDDLSVIFRGRKASIFLWPEEFHPLNVRMIVFLVCFVAIIALALFVIIHSIASGKRLPMLIAGIAGFALTIVFISVFRSMSYDILSGKVNVVDYVVDRILGTGFLVNLIGKAASSAIVLYLTLDGVQTCFLALFIGVAAWTAIFYLVDIGDPNAKKERENEKKAQEEKKLAKKNAKAAKKEAKAKKAEEKAAEKTA